MNKASYEPKFICSKRDCGFKPQCYPFLVIGYLFKEKVPIYGMKSFEYYNYILFFMIFLLMAFGIYLAYDMYNQGVEYDRCEKLPECKEYKCKSEHSTWIRDKNHYQEMYMMCQVKENKN